MSVRHHLVAHRPGALCGVSVFVEGRRPTVTVVVTELPDNPGVSARDAFMDVVHRLCRATLKNVPHNQVAWAYRIPATSQQREVLIKAALGENQDLVERWEHMNSAHIGQLVNRDGGFVRRDVFIPRFRPLSEVHARGRPLEVVDYVAN